jgi:subtilisin family serine protease
MNNRKILVMLILSSLLMGTVPVSAVTPGDNGPFQKLEYKELNLQNNVEYAPEEVIVKFKPGISDEAISDLKSKHAIKSMEKILKDKTVIDKSKINSYGLDRLYLLKLPKNADVDKVVKKFNEDYNIEYAQPNYIYKMDATTNDQYFSYLWGLHNTGQTGGTADADIDAPEAWDTFTGNFVVIGVIDTGIQYTHPDLAANIWTNPGEIPGNGIDDDNNGYTDDVHGWDFANNDNNPWDDNGHGTHVAGTIGAVRNNFEGVAGVNPNVKLMALKFLDRKGRGSTANAVKCINYAEMNNIKITSNSWGGGVFDSALYDAIGAASNSLFVAAAGNEGFNNDIIPHYPSNYNLDNILSVAASDHNDARASFSNYGITSVDIYAPGVDILSTYLNKGYAWASGTSMAAPHASGVAGLLFSMNPSSTPIQIKNIIMNSVDPTIENVVSGGRLNAYSALLSAIPTNVAPVAMDDSATTTQDTPVTIDVAANDNDVDGNLNISTAAVVSDPTNGTVVSNFNGTFDYTPYSNFNGQDSFEYQICDTYNSCDTATVTVTVTPVNDPPVANDDSATTTEETPVTIDVAANDEDDNLNNSTATVVSDPTNGIVVSNFDGTFNYTPYSNFNGQDSFEYQICDTYNSCDTATVTVTVIPVNDPPVANDDSITTQEDTNVTINVAANDNDVDGNLDISTATAVSDPTNGTVINNFDGSFNYTPYSNFNGQDSFDYQICDTDNSCDTATVTITVTEAPALLTMHIASIDMDLSNRNAGKNTFTLAIAIVTIVNNEDEPVSGATVSGYWSEATLDYDSGVTDEYGNVSIYSDEVKNAPSGTNFTFTVTSVTYGSLMWDEGLESNSITV